MNLTQALAIQAETRPEDVAIDFVEGSLSYSELHQAVQQCISHLLKSGVRSGDIVGLSFTDERMVLIATSAVSRIGAIVYLVPALFPKDNKSEMMNAVGVDLLLVDKRNKQTPEGPLALLTFAMLAKIPTKATPIPAVPDPSHCFMILHGSGSTGNPKLIPFSHAQMILICDHQRRRYDSKPGDVWASFLYLNFRTPLIHAMSAVTGGNRFVRSLSNVPFRKMAETCRRLNVAFMYATPSHAFQLLEKLPNENDQALETLKGLIVSFTSVSSALRGELKKRITPNLYVSYGTNEVGLMTILPPEAPDLDGGSVGYVIENNTVEIVDSDGNPVPVGAAGEIRVKNDQNFDGYLRDPEATENAVRDGWFYPRDSGRFLPDGQLVHLGRSDQMMICDGVNIFPAEIERAVSEIDEIEDVAVVPLADPKLGDVPICVFTLKKGVDAEKLGIKDRIRQRLGPRSPKLFFQLPEIPRTEQGKLNRELLYEQVNALREQKGGPAS